MVESIEGSTREDRECLAQCCVFDGTAESAEVWQPMDIFTTQAWMNLHVVLHCVKIAVQPLSHNWPIDSRSCGYNAGRMSVFLASGGSVMIGSSAVCVDIM